MSKRLVVLLSILYIVKCLNDFNEISSSLNDNSDQTIFIDIGLSQNYSIKYNDATNFIFNITDNGTYQVNIHTINCNVKIDFKGEIMNQINLNIYSLEINETSNIIKIKPLIDVIFGKEVENIEQKKCYLSINSINTNDPEIKIENKQDFIFFFKDYNVLNISYEIKNNSTNNFAALLFQFNEKSNFSIDITNNNKNLISKNIYNSTYIYLNSDILKNIMNDNINICIKKNDNDKPINIFFKIVENEMISILQKNSLNYGFMSIKTTYQYFYFEVFKGEEGEIMLHYKRFYDQLLAKIVTKDEINDTDLYNSDEYPTAQSDNNANILTYNPHSLKLTYTYKDTFNCSKGCYILLTYISGNFGINYLNIGYEFTLLSRSWSHSNYLPQIVDIPYNEYILGSFEKTSINTYHYYSIYIPNDAEKIIIQIEGNYIDCFYGEGRKKINTIVEEENDKNINIISKQNITILNIKELNLKGKMISFAFRSKDFFNDIFSFYYFRVFYFKDNDLIYFPMDSQLGNLCLPKYNEETNLYYCHFIFSNKYNGLSTNFSISTSNQNEYYKIYVTKIYKNGEKNNETKEIFYTYYNGTDDIDYFCFTFEFQNSEIKNIISFLYEDRINDYYMQIYSSQMFYIQGYFHSTFYFNMKNNCTLIYKYIFGSIYYLELIGYYFPDFFDEELFYLSDTNSRGKPFATGIYANNKGFVEYIPFYEDIEWLFVLQLEYNIRNKGIIEIKSGETKNQIITSDYFPSHHYLKIKNEDYNNININLRIKNSDNSFLENNFKIKGYMLDEETINRKINGEYIQLGEEIEGYYSKELNVGLLEVNKEKKYNNSNFVLIEIINIDKLNRNSSLLVEVVTKEFTKENYFMPTNQYIIEKFNNNNDTIEDENKYHIYVNQRGDDPIYIELSPEYNDIELIFANETKSTPNFYYTVKFETGFKKYIIYKINDNNIYFNVINPKKRKANYMIRYHCQYHDLFFHDEIFNSTYYLSNEFDKKYIDTNNDNIRFTHI